MNISARLKSVKAKPEYIFNVSIDIPLKSKFAITNRSYEPSPTSSPNKMKKKFKLLSTSNNIKKKDAFTQQKHNISSIFNQQISSKQITSSNNLHNKKRSSNISRKTQKNTGINLKQRADYVCPSRRTVKALSKEKSKNLIRNISILQKIQTEDNVIKYTTNSSQLKRVQSNEYFDYCNISILNKEKNSPQNYQQKFEQLNIGQIREYEDLATQRKQHLNYLYLKQKVIILASVKKIQRAWRKYKTKKLVKSYSHNISVKIAKSSQFLKKDNNFLQTIKSGSKLIQIKDIKQSLNQQKSRSQRFRKIKTDLHTSNNSCQMNFTEIQLKRRKNQNDVNNNLRRFQKQQIQKWDIILQSIKKGNNIQKLLKQSQKFKKQIQSQLNNENNQQNSDDNENEINAQEEYLKIQKQESQIVLKSTQSANKSQQESIKKYIDDNKNKYLIEKIDQKNKIINQKTNEKEIIEVRSRQERMNYYQNQILKLDNQDFSDQKSQSSSIVSYANNQIDKKAILQKKNKNEDLQKKQREQTLKLKKKLQLLENSNILDFGSESQSLTDRSLKRQERQFRRQIQHQAQDKSSKQNKQDFIKIQDKNNRQQTVLNSNTNNLSKAQIQNRIKIQQLLNKRIQYPSDTSSDTSDDIPFDSKIQIAQKSISVNRDQPAKTHRQHLTLPNFSSLIQQYKLNSQVEKPKQKRINMEETLRICRFIEEQMVYQSLLQFSDSDFIVKRIKNLFQSFKLKKQKPEGICTNLQSIKDYLQNFVGFIYQNNLNQQIQSSLWRSSGPTSQTLLHYLRKDKDFYEQIDNEFVMKIQYFQGHWQYANQQIYFDKKFEDPEVQKQRVNYLKGLTRVYFRSIFDAFNQSMEIYRSYGQMGQPYIWSKYLHRQNKHSLKAAFQLSYKRIMKMSVIYCGVHFQNKNQVMTQQTMKQLKQDRMNNLLTFQLQEDEFRWNFLQDDLAELKYQITLQIQQVLLKEVMSWLIQKQMHQCEQQASCE